MTSEDTFNLLKIMTWLEEETQGYSFEGNAILYENQPVMILEYNQLGDGIMEGDQELLLKHARDRRNADELFQRIQAAQKMIAFQFLKEDEKLFTRFRDWLLREKDGILMYENGAAFEIS